MLHNLSGQGIAHAYFAGGGALDALSQRICRTWNRHNFLLTLQAEVTRRLTVNHMPGGFRLSDREA